MVQLINIGTIAEIVFQITHLMVIAFTVLRIAKKQAIDYNFITVHLYAITKNNHILPNFIFFLW